MIKGNIVFKFEFGNDIYMCSFYMVGKGIKNNL